MTSLRWAKLFLSLLSLIVVGCGPTELNVNEKPSYEFLVVVYNSEVQLLDTLEAKRKNLIAEYSEKAQAEAVKAAMNSLESVAKSANTTSPNNALDQAVAAAEAQAQLLKKLEGTSSPNANFEFPEELKRKLSELDDEIAKQKERVERARIARDAEEAK